MKTEIDAFDLIKDWHKVSTGEKVEISDVFFQFMASWVAMNALYNWFCRNGNYGGDKSKLKQFASASNEAKVIHSDLLADNENYRNVILLLAEHGVYDPQNKRTVEIDDITNFAQVILCVYQIRNNLFHGNKSFEERWDEKAVSISLTIVSTFLEGYLNHPDERLFRNKEIN
ncbi:MAG TPA: hypothetical protein VGB02_12285 [Pyrinomonadaceae bacterium]|jgi:hypothetical protein